MNASGIPAVLTAAAPVTPVVDISAVGVVDAVEIVPCNATVAAVVAVLSTVCIPNLLYTPSSGRHAEAPVAVIANVTGPRLIFATVLPISYPIGIW
jgi:hypothetical protein